jgi:hypothetical protein
MLLGRGGQDFPHLLRIPGDEAKLVIGKGKLIVSSSTVSRLVTSMKQIPGIGGKLPQTSLSSRPQTMIPS